MPALILVSLLWAFSFGLTKHHVAGLDPALVSAVRLGLALLVFLPFARVRHLPARTQLGLLGIGGLQFGVMYLAYNASFAHLRAHEVALLTLTTPVMVVFLADALERTWRPRALAAALLAVAGAGVVVGRADAFGFALAGAAWVQLSNAAFAAGQVLYRRHRARHPGEADHRIFALPYAGGFLVAAAVLATRHVPLTATPAQWAALAYLGLIASGLGFFLWNVGATRVGAGTLAVMNNAKVPLAVAVSLVVFREEAPAGPLLLGLALLGGAAWLAEPRARRT